MTAADVSVPLWERFARGQRVRLPGGTGIVVIAASAPDGDGCVLYVEADSPSGGAAPVFLTAAEAERVEVISEDGGGSPAAVLAGLWTEWMLSAVRSAGSTVLASTALKPYPHQMAAVYGRMLPQPQLRFLLADEPGTGKTIMSGLWLREAQRLGMVKRALVVCPAHLVHKWQADFERFFGGGLREVTSETVQQRALSGSSDDTWVVSLHLTAVNPAVREALHPGQAGWDAIIFDEAHRMTPTAETFYRVGKELASAVPNVLFLTATPHRGDEWLFRELMHLVDPDVFPTLPKPGAGRRGRPPADKKAYDAGKRLKPGSLHFLRRMKEDLVDYGSGDKLFKERQAANAKVPLNSTEQDFYDRALAMVDTFFLPEGRSLAEIVYGKRAASSLYALRETLRRRMLKMGGGSTSGVDDADEERREEEQVVGAGSVDAKREKRAIEELLGELEPLIEGGTEASKWDPMMQRVAGKGIFPKSGRQLVVFTEYADTADWLVRRFEDAGFTAKRYSGRDDHVERARIQWDFKEGRFEVIVSTDAGNEGIDLQTAHVLVNWDIPWSLVRLEQRMGRIHRIGQTSKVWFYNLVATGTREGDAHWRLLERLIQAANELDGKMFDCLDAIMELVSFPTGADAEQVLRDCFRQPTFTFGSGDGFPDVEEIRKAGARYYAENEALRSEVDLDVADAARRDDDLKRVNPVIVDRFLARLEQAGVLERHPAPIGEDGFFYISSPLGWDLPEELPTTSEGHALISTDADTQQAAIDRGVIRAAEAVALGPSRPAFQALVEGSRQQVAGDMWRGATLVDRTSPEDYTLFVYECDFTEGEPGRSRTASWLIRVDGAGEAECVSWATLPNLGMASVAASTPLSSDLSDTAAGHARVIAERERERRAAVRRKWVQQLEIQLRPLPNFLTDGIKDRRRRIEQRKLIGENIKNRLSSARSSAKVACGEPRRIGWAQVTGSPETDEDEQESDQDGHSETVSMHHVMNRLRNGGWQVRDVHTQDFGYDLHAFRGPEQRCVEVKGLAGRASSNGVRMTGGEWLAAAQLGDDYWLYVVENCVDGEGALYGAWRNPAQTFADGWADVSTVRLPGSKLKAALNDQGDDP